MKANLLNDCYSSYITSEHKKKIAREWHYSLRTLFMKTLTEAKYIQSRKIIYKALELKKDGFL